MRDLSPQPEIATAMLQGVDFHPEADRLPHMVHFSEEHQVLVLPRAHERPGFNGAVLGYLAVMPDEEGRVPDTIAVNHSHSAELTVEEPKGAHLFNTQEALTASLSSARSATYVRGLYAWDMCDNLHAKPYSKIEWLRGSLWRAPQYPDGAMLHGPSLMTMIRYQKGRLQHLLYTPRPRQNREVESNLSLPEQKLSRATVPPRRLSVFRGILWRLGTVSESEE